VARDRLRVLDRVRAGAHGEQEQEDGAGGAQSKRRSAQARQGGERDPRGEPGRDPRDDQSGQWLGVRRGQVLQFERARDPRPDGEHPGLAQQVQPPGAGHDRHERGEQERRCREHGAGAVTRLLVIGLLALWSVVGGLGTWSYAHDYEVYRGFPPPRETRGIPKGRLVHVSFWSSALHERRYYVLYLPPRYAAAAARGVRFPVLYLLHAPPGRPENYVLAGAMDVRYDLLLARHRIRPFLIAMPNGHSHAFGSDTEWANARAGPYESFLLDTVRAVDARWSTIPTRSARMIAGLSEGGYGAANIALRHAAVFGGFESWSGYFRQTPTYAFTGERRSVLRANSPLLYAVDRASTLRRFPMHAFLYQGQSDDVSVSDMRLLARELRATGAQVNTALYSGGHNWRLWRAHFNAMLRYASDVLGGPR
jgi:enterochelin esterase-like enzyme